MVDEAKGHSPTSLNSDSLLEPVAHAIDLLSILRRCKDLGKILKAVMGQTSSKPSTMTMAFSGFTLCNFFFGKCFWSFFSVQLPSTSQLLVLYYPLFMA